MTLGPRTVRTPPNEEFLHSAEPESGIEQRLTDLQAKLDALKAQVRQAQQLAGLGTAAATIAHEVNNLLTPILSWGETALETGDRDLQVKALTVTVKNVNMLIAMSRRILELGAAKPAKRESASVRTAAEDAAASLCRDLSKDGIKFALDAGDEVAVWADPLQLQQVLFNLFLNARQAMAPSHSGRLSVCARQHDDRVVIQVRNTGPPIPPELLPHVFDPFQTSKSAEDDERSRCSGLGLALCRDLVEENGGTIEVASSPDAGTTFTLRLPTPPHKSQAVIARE